MEVILWNILQFIFGIVELGIFKMYLVAMGPKKERSSLCDHVVLAIVSGIIYLKGQMNLSVFLNGVLGCVILFLYALFISDLSWEKSIMHALIYFVLVGVLDLGVGVVVNLFIPVNLTAPIGTISMAGCFSIIISKIILFIIVINILMKQKYDGKLFKSSLALMVCVFISTLTYVCNIVDINMCIHRESSSGLNTNLCLLVLGLFLIDIVSYYIIMQLNIKLNEEKNYELVAYHNQILTKAVMNNKTVEEAWRKNKHDFNNHLGCVDMLLQMNNVDKARAYIQKLTQRYLEQSTSVKLGNEIVDAVINQKVMLARKGQINIEVTGGIEKPINIQDMDLCALLSNSIDNAIEATTKIENVDDRQIWVNVKTFDQHLIIDIGNAVQENIKGKAILKTTKGDKKKHGIGMKSMQQVVDTYHGHMEWKCEKQWFSLIILLPVVDEKYPS